VTAENENVNGVNTALAQPAPAAAAAPDASASAIFSILQVVSLVIYCPDIIPSATMLGNGTRTEYRNGAFALELNFSGQAGALIMVRFDDVNTVRQLTTALGLAASTITHFLTRQKRIMPAAASPGASRSGSPGVGSDASGASAGSLPAPSGAPA
jgi:hypothetical protein